MPCYWGPHGEEPGWVRRQRRQESHGQEPSLRFPCEGAGRRRIGSFKPSGGDGWVKVLDQLVCI